MTENETVGWHHHLMDMSLSKLRKLVKDREVVLQFMGSQQVGDDLAIELQCQLKFFFFFLNKLWEQRTLKFLYINGTILKCGYEDIHCKSHYKIVSTIMVPAEKEHSKLTTNSILEESSFQTKAAKGFGYFGCISLC